MRYEIVSEKVLFHMLFWRFRLEFMFWFFLFYGRRICAASVCVEHEGGFSWNLILPQAEVAAICVDFFITIGVDTLEYSWCSSSFVFSLFEVLWFYCCWHINLFMSCRCFWWELFWLFFSRSYVCKKLRGGFWFFMFSKICTKVCHSKLLN